MSDPVGRRSDDEIRDRHTSAPWVDGPARCSQCLQVWPCDTELVLRTVEAQAERIAELEPENERLRNGIPRQRKGLNPFLPDAPVRKAFTDEGVMQHIGRWCDAEREKEAWRDGDTNTYRYRANLLEAAVVRFAAAQARAVAAEADNTRLRAEVERLNALVAVLNDDADLALIARDEAVEAESQAGDRIAAERDAAVARAEAAEAKVRAVLHEVWLAVHVKRFAADHGETNKPDCFYAGVIQSEHEISEVAKRYGVDWHQLRAAASPSPEPQPQQEEQR